MEQDYLLQEEHFLYDTLTNQPPQEETKFLLEDGTDIDEIVNNISKEKIIKNYLELIKRIEANKI